MEGNFLCGDAAKVSWIFITKFLSLCVPEVLPHPHVPKESDTMTYVLLETKKGAMRPSTWHKTQLPCNLWTSQAGVLGSGVCVCLGSRPLQGTP